MSNWRPILLWCCFLAAGGLAVPLYGQPNMLDKLAEELCGCVTDGGLTPAAADSCLVVLCDDNAVKLEDVFKLDAKSIYHRRALANRLATRLVHQCPIMTTLSADVNEERELRWSDAKIPISDASDFALRSAKGLAPPAKAGATEPATVPTVSGTLVERPGPNGLRLRLADGRVWYFRLPKAVSRKRDFRKGQQVTLTYLREWRITDGIVVRVVTKIY